MEIEPEIHAHIIDNGSLDEIRTERGSLLGKFEGESNFAMSVNNAVNNSNCGGNRIDHLMDDVMSAEDGMATTSFSKDDSCLVFNKSSPLEFSSVL